MPTVVSRREIEVGTVRALFRYPVKSTAGQALQSAALVDGRVEHDRRWAAYTEDGGIASGKRTRRFRPVIGLMRWASAIEDGQDVPILVSPQGARYRVDDPAASDALSRAFGQRLTLRPETTIQHHDEAPIHLLTTSSLAAVAELVGAGVDQRRYRANILVDTGTRPEFLEDAWSGLELVTDRGVALRLAARMPRCVMVDQAQAYVTTVPATLKAIGTHHGLALGLQAWAVGGGTIRVGDRVILRPAPS